MSTAPHSDLVAALHLLLSDLDIDSRVYVLRQAFPNLLLIEKGQPAERATEALINTRTYLQLARGIVDGSSGLGALAAKNASNYLVSAANNISAAIKLLRIT